MGINIYIKWGGLGGPGTPIWLHLHGLWERRRGKKSAVLLLHLQVRSQHSQRDRKAQEAVTGGEYTEVRTSSSLLPAQPGTG